MSTAYVALGGNQGDRLAHLEAAVGMLRDAGEALETSPLYETEPVGYAKQPWFLNGVTLVATDKGPLDLLRALQGIETKLGKATPFPNGPRTIDLDLLLYDDLVGSWPGLDLPHPRMHERRFVLAPLADIAPDLVHPTLHRTIRELLQALAGGSAIRPWNGRSRIFPKHA